ncbi:SEC7-like [Macleaya cordata]|uniref:SEC7-like n=1 Tax=Macleaya cordata TaxID=56857 RepID=A0A200PXA3_MACCD|nr:SEC7-like [Macleaya cordata]
MTMGSLKLLAGIEANGQEPRHCIPSSTAFACMINSEIGALLAVVRRNVRWGGRYMTEDDQLEHSLIQSLKSLRKKLFSWDRQWNAVDPSIYLQPFLDVIRSDEIGAPITGVALSSVYKILTLGILDPTTVNVKDAMHLVVEAVTSCRFEVTDSASEEVVLMKILQVLLACMKSKAAFLLNNQHVCTIVNTCFRIVHQAGTKGELLQRIARHTMHELVRCIFLHLQHIHCTGKPSIQGAEPSVKPEVGVLEKDNTSEVKQPDSVNDSSENASISADSVGSLVNETAVRTGRNEEAVNDVPHSMREPYGVACVVEVFQFLCSLLNVGDQIGMGPRLNWTEFDEDVPLFALGLINSAIELGGSTVSRHPELLALIKEELFPNLMQLGLSMSPLILSMVCNIILNLYLHLRTELKLQLEAFLSSVILRLAQSKHGDTSYQQQEVLMEALVDLCRQKTFMAEMYANFDCDISCSNVFEDVSNLLSKSAFPVNSPLSSMHVLALEGLVAVVQGFSERIGSSPTFTEQTLLSVEQYSPFWNEKCENYADPNSWVGFVRHRKQIKKALMMGVDHFNRDPKKGLEFLQRTHLLPNELDPQSVACFFRYTTGLDKSIVGDFLGNHEDFWVKVLQEFAQTFDFQDMSLDIALRLFLETFRLPGESQKIQRVLEAFSERFYDQSPQILANKDAALVLSYSIILLNTDQHNVRVKKKMTEEDFVRNNRRINGGNDLPREFLLDLYNSICKNEIRMTPEQGVGPEVVMPSHWINLMHKSKTAAPFITCDPKPFLDRDMFSVLSGPTLAAICVVFDHAEKEDIYQTCVDGFLAMAKIASCSHLVNILDDLVISLCKFTTLLDPSQMDEPILAFADDTKAMMATITVFTIANNFGDYIRTGWRNILDCILSLHKIGLLPSLVASNEQSSDPVSGKPIIQSASYVPVKTITSQRSSGFMGRFTQLLSLDTEQQNLEPTEEELEARQRAHLTIEKCQVSTIFTDSMFLQSDSLLQLVQALIWVSGPSQKGKNGSPEDEDTAIFCLELLITITLYNRDRIVLLWPGVYEHIAGIVQSATMPSAFVEKAVFGLLHICQRLLPYKENLADELLRSLQLILKLDARVADAYCEQITQEIADLVKTNAMCIKSQMGWRTITSLLSITARHPEASDVGFEALAFVMSDGSHLSPVNYSLCVDACRQFTESRVGSTERSIHALDLMAGSLTYLTQWKLSPQEAGEIWLGLVKGLRKVSLDQREEVRNHSILSLQRCTAGIEGFSLPQDSWVNFFDLIVFQMLDDFLEIVQGKSSRDYRNIENTLLHALKLSSKVFLQQIMDLSPSSSFPKLWMGILGRMEIYTTVKIRGKKSEKLRELVPELLKNMLLVMKSSRVLVNPSSSSPSSDTTLWEMTWPLIDNLVPNLKSEVFPDREPELTHRQKDTATPTLSDVNTSTASIQS